MNRTRASKCRRNIVQAIHQHAVGELIFDSHYLGGQLIQDFVQIAIAAGRPRSIETTQLFYRDLLEKLGRATGLSAEDAWWGTQLRLAMLLLVKNNRLHIHYRKKRYPVSDKLAIQAFLVMC